MNVMVVPDVTPYKKRKVRILNGAHTGFVLGAYLAGFDIVRDCMHNDTIRGFMNKMLHEEIIPTLPLDKKDLEEFASAVEDRFNNPFVNHELMSISLNSTSKWKARNMPSFLTYIEEQKKLPKCLTMSLAAYIASTPTTFRSALLTASSASARQATPTRSRMTHGLWTSTMHTRTTPLLSW